VARRLFTSESVTEGHPDKIADQISDGVLDALLAQDPRSRVAVETLITTGQVHVAGEVTTQAYADIASIVRETILGIGYDSSLKGFDGHSCGVMVAIGGQSGDIAQGVDSGHESRTGSVLELGRAKLARKGCDLLVVNDVSGGAVFGAADNQAVILAADGAAVDVPLGSKSSLAHVIWDQVVARMS